MNSLQHSRTSHFRRTTAILFAALSLLISCKKDDIKTAPHEEKDEITQAGTEIETAKSASIGPNGGKLISRDGKLEITIPAGALASNTTISVAAISNTSSAAIGLNYRITPHMDFAKPVTLTFSYADKADSLASASVTGIGFRDDNGVWKVKKKSRIDQSNKKISVTTDHFSDWAALELVKLSPVYSVIEPSQSVKITAYTCVALKEIYDLDKVFDPNGPDESLSIVEPYELPEDYIVDMYAIGSAAQGVGTVKAEGTSSAVYTASAEINPAINPVTIAFPLTTKTTTMILSAKVKVLYYPEGVYIRMGGKGYSYHAEATINSAGRCDMEFTRTENGQLHFYGGLSWKGQAGVFPWNDNTDFWWEPDGFNPTRVYQHLYDDGLKFSPGSIRVALIEPVGGFIMGTFVIEQAGATNTQSGNAEYLGASRIEGTIKVKRVG